MTSMASAPTWEPFDLYPANYSAGMSGNPMLVSRTPSPTPTCDFSVLERPNTPESQFQTLSQPLSPTSRSPSPRALKHILKLFSNGSSTPSRKGKAKASVGPARVNWEEMSPLDGDEGEYIEFDEACFVDVRQVAGIDIVAELPAEVGLYLLASFLELPHILSCLAVSRRWRTLAQDNMIWRSLFLLAGWTIDVPHAQARGWGRDTPHCPDWRTLYRTRYTIERRWTATSPSSTYIPSKLQLVGHSDSVYCVEFDSSRIVTGSRDRSIHFWSIETGRLVNTVFGHLGSVLCLKFDPDWDLDPTMKTGMMVSGSSDRSTIVWDLKALGHDGSVYAKKRAVLYGHTGGVLDLRMNKQWIASCSKDGDIRVWTRATLSLHGVLTGHSGPVNAVGMQGNNLVSASGDGRMILWDLKERKRVRTFAGHDRGLACIAYEGSYVLSGSSDCTIKVWNVETGSCVRTLIGHGLLVRALAVDVKAGRLVSASYDRTIKVWDLNTGRLIREFGDIHASHIFDVKFDAGKIISASHDRKIVVMNFLEGLQDTELFV